MEPAAMRTICCRWAGCWTPRANLLSPRGKVLENGMPRFFRRLSEGVFDIPDLIARTRRTGRVYASAADGLRL